MIVPIAWPVCLIFLLPEAFRDSTEADNFKFADRAIEVLVGSMEKLGCLRYRLTAKIAGGAKCSLQVVLVLETQCRDCKKRA
jgi:chemotaxis receptor (MCP) glutamine deamidase CheD